MGQAVGQGTWTSPPGGARSELRPAWAWALVEHIVSSTAGVNAMVAGAERRRVAADCIDVEVRFEDGIFVAHVHIWRRKAAN